MKQILSSLLAAYTLTNGQAPPGTTAAATTTGAPAVVDPIASLAPVDPIIIVDPIVPPVIEPAPSVIDPAPAVVDPTTQPPIVILPAEPAPPVTPSPVTPAPVTQAPTTAAPTLNPYCPMGGVLSSQHGVTSGNMMSTNQGCLSPYERAVAFNGKLQCSSFACCQCASIQCGDPFGLACDELVISDSGAVGNQNINVLGDMTSAFGGNSFAGIGGAMNNGAHIKCSGLEACKASKIYGKYVGQMDCAGDMGCAGSNVYLEDPGTDFQFKCTGMMGCMNMNLEIVITAQSQVAELDAIEFNGQQSAQGMTVTIRNNGLYPLMMRKIECHNPTACPNLRVNIIGQVFIENCDLQHMNIATAGPSLLAACQAGGIAQGNYMPGLGMPPQFPPQVPPQGPPVNPGSFTPVAPAPAPQQPVVPAPVVPAPAPQQPQQYNPYGPQNPYCNPMSSYYDIQHCYEYAFMYGQQPGYNPYGQQFNPYQYNPWI